MNGLHFPEWGEKDRGHGGASRITNCCLCGRSPLLRSDVIENTHHNRWLYTPVAYALIIAVSLALVCCILDMKDSSPGLQALSNPIRYRAYPGTHPLQIAIIFLSRGFFILWIEINFTLTLTLKIWPKKSHHPKNLGWKRIYHKIRA